MKLVFPKLFAYSSMLLIIALAQAVLLLKLVTAPSSAISFGTIFLGLFVGSQVLLALAGLVFSFRPRKPVTDA